MYISSSGPERLCWANGHMASAQSRKAKSGKRLGIARCRPYRCPSQSNNSLPWRMHMAARYWDPCGGKRLTCAHKTDSVVHTDSWPSCTRTHTKFTHLHTQPWVGVGLRKKRVWSTSHTRTNATPLPATYHRTSALGGGVGLGKKRVGSTSHTRCLTSL